MRRRPSLGCAVAGTHPSPDSSRVSVPKLNQDPVQSLQPYPVLITLGGEDFEIPAKPAVDWLSVLMSAQVELDEVLPGFLDQEDTEVFEELIISGHLGMEEYEKTILDIIEVASARNWWVALRLVEQARTSWDIIGAEMVLRGLDARQMSLSAWLDALLLVLLRSMDQKDVQMFCLKLEAPPENVEGEASEPEISAAQFMTMAG